MDWHLIVLIASFLILLVLNVPIAFAIGISSLLTIFTIGGLPEFLTVAYKIATGIDSFALLAIPFFILAGQLMGHGGIARRLIDFANVLVGRFPGGLAYVNTVACMFFGAISGSAVAATSAIGSFMIPSMNKEGFDKNFNTAVTVTGSTTGLLIPPSNVLIVYSLASGGVSIAALFIAGYLPGFIVGLGLIIVSAIISIIKKYPVGVCCNSLDPNQILAALKKNTENQNLYDSAVEQVVKVAETELNVNVFQQQFANFVGVDKSDLNPAKNGSTEP